MANALLCTEKLDNRRAGTDPVIHSDPRVMDNLLANEKSSMITDNYFVEVQMDITPGMRHIVIEWMMEVCEELVTENQVFPLAVRLMDKFLSCCNTSRQHLQLLGAVCLHVASKARQVYQISTDTLIHYSDNSITKMDMLRVELMLLLRLDWQISRVTASDFVEHILNRVPWAKENPMLRRHAHLLLQLCCSDHESIATRPSVIACGCLIAAARGLRIPSRDKVASHVCSLTKVNEADAYSAEQHVEALVRQEEARHLLTNRNQNIHASSQQQTSLKPNSSASVSGNGSVPLDILIDEDDAMDTSQPETPTDVQDVHF